MAVEEVVVGGWWRRANESGEDGSGAKNVRWRSRSELWGGSDGGEGDDDGKWRQGREEGRVDKSHAESSVATEGVERITLEVAQLAQRSTTNKRWRPKGRRRGLSHTPILKWSSGVGRRGGRSHPCA